MEAANILPNEKVQIVNNNNGERFETYVIKGERGSGTICLNGAAARKVQKGDIVIIMAYALMEFEAAKTFHLLSFFPTRRPINWSDGRLCPVFSCLLPIVADGHHHGLVTQAPAEPPTLRQSTRPFDLPCAFSLC
jgi:hypothetical protein